MVCHYKTLPVEITSVEEPTLKLYGLQSNLILQL